MNKPKFIKKKKINKTEKKEKKKIIKLKSII